MGAPAHTTGLSYERGLLVNEVTFYGAAAAGGPTIPRVVHSELDPGAPPGAYVVMTACPGRPGSAVASDLTPGENRAPRSEFGGVVDQLHRVTGPAGFGYPAEPLGPLSPTRRAAFTAMTDAVLSRHGHHADRLIPRRPTGLGLGLRRGAASDG
ncbi:hypothetical protein ACFYQ5_17595 [Streptomyces sp. NPDC005794]|uniref:hypothetical protein n=1 Tax=Streptomyces sp. NPDC005794 TaxID=3364733 RepID=UPI0036AA3BA3